MVERRQQKTYLYKVYTVSGTQSTFLKTWNDVLGFPEFEVNINSGMGEMRLVLPRAWNNFGEGQDVKSGNVIKVFVSDIDTGDDDALLLASGYISGYTPKIMAGESESIEVSILGNSSRLNQAILTASGNTMVTFNSVDPSTIASSVIGLYNTTVSGSVQFGTSIDFTGNVVSYDFKLNTYRAALDKVIELCPQRWYYRIDPDDTVHLHVRDWSPKHRLVIGRDIVSISPFKNIENIVNVVYFIGNGIELVVRNSSSILAYGERSEVIEDRRVSLVASANIIANTFLNTHSNPEVRTTLTVIDNNFDSTGKGYDIEKFKVGEMVSIIHPNLNFERTLFNDSKFNESKFNGPIEYVLSTPMQIQRISYMGDRCVLELSSRSPDVSKRLEDINRNLKQFITAELTA